MITLVSVVCEVWLPTIDRDIDTLVKACLPCLSVKSSPPKSPLNPWKWPAKPWSRIHVDFAGPVFGKMYFIVVDAHSKWPEVFIMSSTTSTKTIDVLRTVFGLPDQLVSDNGPQFTSEEFTLFLRKNGIRHTRTAPYHPATNGAAECFVQTLKKAILVGKDDPRSCDHKLASFLLSYRSTPHSVTGVSPSVLLNGRRIKTVLDILKPDLGDTVRKRKEVQKSVHYVSSKERLLEVGDSVVVKVHHGNTVSWEPVVL